jgi:hypothetical protein
MDEQEVCAGTPVGCRAALGFVEKQLCEAAQLLLVRSERRRDFRRVPPLMGVHHSAPPSGHGRRASRNGSTPAGWTGVGIRLA